MSKAAFPLGVYLGYPNSSDAVAEAQFASDYGAFTSLMGSAPSYNDTFVDYLTPMSQWAPTAALLAQSAAKSAVASSLTPVIAIPLYSVAAGAGTPDDQYLATVAGRNDGVIQGVVAAWAGQGYKNLVVRPGWEMNIPGNTYAGDTAGEQADWVSAFRHVYTVLHAAAAADGVQVNVVWNPGIINYSLAEATTNLYPGDAFVDSVGADAYSDIYPYSDSSTSATYHDWDTGGQDATVAQFVADPVDREHYWSLPAATVWLTDTSNGHSQSLDSLISFAEAHGKAFSVPEAGAGNSDGGHDVKDDPSYAQWLAQELAVAQRQGETVSFVNLWDSNSGGNYMFSSATNGKPMEAASWGKYFGSSSSSPANANGAVLPPVVAQQTDDLRIMTNRAFTFTIAPGTFYEAAGLPVAYTVKLATGGALPSWVTFNVATGTFSGTSPAAAGTLGIEVDGTDSVGSVAGEAFKIYTSAAKPLLVSQTGDLRTAGGTAFSFTVPKSAFTDPSGGGLTYTVKQVDGTALPPWVAFDASSGIVSGITPAAGSALGIRVDAVTSEGFSAAEAFKIYSTPATPILSRQTGDGRYAAGQPVSIGIDPGTFIDPAGGSISYSVRSVDGSALPAWLSFSPSTATLTGTAPASGASVGILVQATSSELQVAAEAFHIYTQPAPPTFLTQAPDQWFTDGQAFSFALPVNSFSDPAGGTLSHVASLVTGGALPPWISFNPANDVFSGTAPAAPGSLAVRIDAIAPSGGSSAEAFHIYFKGAAG